jgi:sporulation protein YlmC with PRC-barrel domain
MPCTVNKKVACKPFEKTSIEKEIKGGFAMVKQSVSVASLEVVFDFILNTETDTDFIVEEGDSVYVKGDMSAAVWAKEVLEIDSKKFILVPWDCVIAIEN